MDGYMYKSISLFLFTTIQFTADIARRVPQIKTQCASEKNRKQRVIGSFFMHFSTFQRASKTQLQYKIPKHMENTTRQLIGRLQHGNLYKVITQFLFFAYFDLHSILITLRKIFVARLLSFIFRQSQKRFNSIKIVIGY